MYARNLDHLLAEMERIDLLLRGQVVRARGVAAADEQFRGLCISEEEVDRLLETPIGVPVWAVDRPERSADVAAGVDRLRQDIADNARHSQDDGAQLRLPMLARRFGLDDIDVDCLLICLAPELDLRYERIYAYLHDDVTRRRPSIDLVLGLLSSSPHAKLTERRRFAPDAPLVRHRLIDVVDEGRQPLLAQSLKIDERVASYLLGVDALDARIRTVCRISAPSESVNQLLDEELRRRLRAFAQRQDGSKAAVLYLQGPYGSGKRSVAHALCADVQREFGVRPVLLEVDLEQLLAAGDTTFVTALPLLHREASMQNGVALFKNFDLLLSENRRALKDEFVRVLEEQRGVVLLAGDLPWEPTGRMQGISFVRLELPRPPASRRAQLWSALLGGEQGPDNQLDVAELASKFRFSGGQIRDAVDTARSLAHWRHGGPKPLSMPDLYEACRVHSNQQLRTLSRKITPRYRWADIVLPANRLEQLRDICNYVKYREHVFGGWGFDRKLSYGKGLSALFAGPSGTGKTMAAEIIAGELGLDLYKIDLSSIVSKYIGETEKNLSKIFTEAETSNAILFFDEADALFGKRSEVKDSHDRYANIEIGYLLQRIEEYDGVVILATNFRKNIDEAFVRRLHFTIEFPFPNEAERRRLWDVVWPDEAPRDPDVDFGALAQRFEITGGNVRNIALAAAFLAADQGTAVQMKHLLRATQRELQKMGKIVGEGQFDHGGPTPRPGPARLTAANHA